MDRLVAVTTTDCHNIAEEAAAFYETFTQEVPLPTTATMVWTTVHAPCRVLDLGDCPCSSAATARVGCSSSGCREADGIEFIVHAMPARPRFLR